MPGLVNRRVLRIEFGNCDPARIVYYPNYVAWIDQSTHHLFEAAGMPLREMQATLGLQVPIVDLSMKFLGPAGWGDEIEIESSIGRWGSKSFDLAHRITDARTGAAIAEARETRVCVQIDPSEPKKLKGRSIPDEMRRAFALPNPNADLQAP
jgi:4-hydroxybenzoyl-CoA thioesterase